MLVATLSGCEIDILSQRYGLPIATSDGPNAPTAGDHCAPDDVNTGIVDKNGRVVACTPTGNTFVWTALPEQGSPTPLIIVYGDSIAVESSNQLRAALGPDWTVVLRTFGGTAPCDWSEWAERDIRAYRPAIVLTSFIGNAGSPCTVDDGMPSTETLVRLYTAHLATIARAGAAWGAQVILTTAPPPSATGFVERTSAIATATWQVARALAAEGLPVFASDDGGVLQEPTANDRVGAQWLPCDPDGSEQGACVDGSVQVHAPPPDGIHLCPTLEPRPSPDDCAVRNIGAERYAAALADTVRAVAAHAPLPFDAPATPTGTPSSDFVSSASERLVDTRANGVTVDGLYAGIGTLAPGSVTRVQIGGRGATPTDAVAVALNVTAVGPEANGFVSVVPCGSGIPHTSSLNYVGGATIANAVVAALGGDGAICLYSSARTGLVVDTTGWFPAGTKFRPVSTARLLDTRPGGVTADGLANHLGRRAAGSVTEVQIAGRGGVPADASAAVVNVTAATPSGSGFVSIDSCGAAAPTTSNLNFSAARTVANSAVVRLSATGTVCIRTSAATHLLLDISGWLPAGGTYRPLTPVRVLDTRPNGDTTDDRYAHGGARLAGSVTAVRIVGRGGVLHDATAAVLTVTVTGAERGGFLTVYVCDGGPPGASTVNFAPGSTIANTTIAALSGDGKVCVFTSAGAQVVLDVTGWFGAGLDA